MVLLETTNFLRGTEQRCLLPVSRNAHTLACYTIFTSRYDRHSRRFYVGFKNNASYERLWEGRKIWASIISLSRIVGTIAASIDSSGAGEAFRQRLIFRQIAWANLLRLQLRQKKKLHGTNRLAPEVSLVGMLQKNPVSDSDLHVSNMASEPDQPDQILANYLERCRVNPIFTEDKKLSAATENPALHMLKEQIADVNNLAARLPLKGKEADLLLSSMIDCIKEQGCS